MAKPVEIVAELTADLSRDRKLATRVEVLRDEQVIEVLGETMDAALIDGSVTLDANAAVRGRLSATFVGSDELIPTSSDSLLAPYGNELRVYRGIELADRIELVSLGIFRIDSAEAGGGADRVISVSGQDRMARFTGADGSFEVAGQTSPGGTVNDVVLELLLPVFPNLDHDLIFDTGSLPAIAYEEGGDRGDFCVQLVKAFGGELYFDRAGTLLTRRVTTPVSGAYDAAFSEGETLLDVSRAWDRDSVYNQVIVTGESSGDDPPFRGVAYDANGNSPTDINGPFGRKTLFWPNPFILSDAQAANAADGILAKVTGAPDIVNFSTLPDPARNPGDVVRVTRESLGLTYDYVIDSLTIPLSHSGTMSGATRATNLVV